MLEIYKAGMEHYETTLKEIVKEPTLKLPRRRAGEKGTHDEELVKLKTSYLKMLSEKRNNLRKKFSDLFGDIQDLVYHVACAKMSNQILIESSLLSVVFYKITSYFILL